MGAALVGTAVGAGALLVGVAVGAVALEWLAVGLALAVALALALGLADGVAEGERVGCCPLLEAVVRTVGFGGACLAGTGVLTGAAATPDPANSNAPVRPPAMALPAVSDSVVAR